MFRLTVEITFLYFSLFSHSFAFEPPNNTSEGEIRVVIRTHRSKTVKHMDIQPCGPKRWDDPPLLFFFSLSYLCFVLEVDIFVKGQGERTNPSPSLLATWLKRGAPGNKKHPERLQGGRSLGKQYYRISYKFLSSILSYICVDLIVIKIPNNLRTKLTDRWPSGGGQRQIV